MIEGLYAAASGLIAIENRQAVISNNIANASTPGFKRQTPVERGFYQVYLQHAGSPVLLDAERAPGGGVKLDETFSDYSLGVVSDTGNPLDLALVGPGFITVQTPSGERLTRNGKLNMGADGALVTQEGYQVLGVDGGPIDVRGGNVAVQPDGRVTVDGQGAGQIRMLEFSDLHMLERAGHSLYYAPQAAMEKAVPAENTTIAAESLERSNVQLPYEMINMMTALRAYGANQRVINTFEETTSRLIDQVGTPA